MPISALRVIYFAVVGGAVCFLIIAAALAGPPKTDLGLLVNSPAGLVLSFVALIQIAGAVAAIFWYPEVARKRLETEAMRDREFARQIATSYTTYVLITTSLAESAIFLCSIGFIIVEHLALLVLAVVALGVCLYLLPTERRAIEYGRRVAGKSA